MPERTASLSRPTPWREVIILCRKCGKKLDGGFGRKEKDSLKDVLSQTLRDAGRRREVRVMETSCLGICPRDGVTALNAGSPGMIHVIPAGTDAQVLLRTLLGDHTRSDKDAVGAT
jgi:predicted metal-binding protein